MPRVMKESPYKLIYVWDNFCGENVDCCIRITHFNEDHEGFELAISPEEAREVGLALLELARHHENHCKSDL